MPVQPEDRPAIAQFSKALKRIQRMTIELIYDRDCPTRTNLRRACEEAGCLAEWLEWERAAPANPAYAALCGSPTVLIRGKDVAGGQPTNGQATARGRLLPERRSEGRGSFNLSAMEK